MLTIIEFKAKFECEENGRMTLILTRTDDGKGEEVADDYTMGDAADLLDFLSTYLARQEKREDD